MERKKKVKLYIKMKILFIYLFISILFPSSNNYIIDFYGIDIMYVSDNTIDTLLLDDVVKMNHYNTQTTGPFNIIFPTNNIYTTYYDENYSPILYIKDINQFGNVKYHANINSKHTISDLKFNNTLNIFSLLDYIEDNSPNIDNEKIIIQGNMIYNCSIKKISIKNEVIKYSIDFVPIKKLNVDDDKEDVFTDHVFNTNGTRYIWVNTNKKQIERCKFKLGFMKLNARRVHNQ